MVNIFQRLPVTVVPADELECRKRRGHYCYSVTERCHSECVYLGLGCLFWSSLLLSWATP